MAAVSKATFSRSRWTVASDCEGLLQPVVEVLHLLGRQAESPIVQIALFVSVVVGQ